jgi:hypothetical protein
MTGFVQEPEFLSKRNANGNWIPVAKNCRRVDDLKHRNELKRSVINITFMKDRNTGVMFACVVGYFRTLEGVLAAAVLARLANINLK